MWKKNRNRNQILDMIVPTFGYEWGKKVGIGTTQKCLISKMDGSYTIYVSRYFEGE